MDKAIENRVLLIGSLPPMPSFAAQWTQLIAERLVACDIEVVVLIDEMSPPPIDLAGVKTVRPFDQEFTEGTFNSWARLVVLGSKPDSLAQIAFLKRCPTSVLVTDLSLFNLAHANAALTHTSSNFRSWLEDAYGEAGATLGNALFDHKRVPTQIGEDIPAYGFVIPDTCAVAGITTRQIGHLAEANPSATQLPDAFFETADTPPEPDGKHRICIIGLPKDLESAFAAQSKLPEDVIVTFRDRFSDHIIEEIQTAKTVAVLDGHETALCPLAVRAISSGKHVIVADQPWISNLPPGRIDTVPNAQSLQALTHALQFATSRSLPAVNQQSATDYAPSQGAKFVSALMRCAGRSAQDTLQPDVLAFEVQGPRKTAPTEKAAAGIWSLVGAVPVKPILEQLYPQLNLDKCPRFLSLEHGRYLAALMDTPLLAIAGHLGCEDAFITDAPHTSDPRLTRKIKPWQHVAPHLLQGEKALAFGCSFEGAHQAQIDSAATAANWSFSLPADLADNPDLLQLLDRDTGIFWRYDPYQNTVSILLATGGRGTLDLSLQTGPPCLISDGTQTAVVRAGASVQLSAPEHGMLLAKVTNMPQASGQALDVRKTLAGEPINLKWSPNA